MDIVTKVEKGLIDDDFVKDRITLKAMFKSGGSIPCKLYDDGRLVYFRGYLDTYEEQELSTDVANQIRSLI